MILGKVVGSVWGGKEAQSLESAKLLNVQPVRFLSGASPVRVNQEKDVPLSDDVIVALDRLGAGVGEYVLVAHGSRVRDITVGRRFPTKEVVVAIVDSCEVDSSLFPEEKQE